MTQKMEKKLIKQLALPLSFRNVKNHSNFILNKVNEVALSLIDEFKDIKKFKKKFNFPVLIRAFRFRKDTFSTNLQRNHRC